MKYTVIGAGGTGGCIGGYLAKAGCDVTLIARGEHLEAIKSDGLCVNSARVGNFNVKGIHACTMEDYEGTPDVIFVCVKYYSLPDAVGFIKKHAAPSTVVIPVLNVFGTGGMLQEECSGCVILDGCIYIMSMIERPGVISQPTPIFRLFFGYRSGQEKRLEEKVLKIVDDCSNAQIETHYTDNILRDALQKFSFVSPMGVAGLYYDATGKDFLVKGEPQDTFFELVREVCKLGNAMGITFDEDLVEVNRVIMEGLTPDSTTSMQRDVKKGGMSEIDGLLHRIVRLAHEYNVSLPTYEKISEWAKEKGIK